MQHSSMEYARANSTTGTQSLAVLTTAAYLHAASAALLQMQL
jgi:hypothetical protein